MKLRATHCITGNTVELDVTRKSIASARVVRGAGPDSVYVGPSLTDLQVNGFGGVDFNSLPLESEDIQHVSEQLVKTGVTRFFPTVITNAAERVVELLGQINQACARDRVLAGHIPGIHLEGPFISPEEGARGAHPEMHIRPPDWKLFEKFQKAAGGRIKIVTLSPEWKNSPSFIRLAASRGIVVSIGHTMATPEQIRLAVRSGATMSTHLGNGAPLLLPRHPNFIWEQLANDNLTACLIADGFHVPPSFIKSALCIKNNKAVLVSDSTMFAGMHPGNYSAHIGGEVRLDASGRLSTRSNPAILAGAALPLKAGIDFLLNQKLTTLKQAWSMASVHANRAVGIRTYAVRGTNPADAVFFERRRGRIQILRVFKMGQEVFPGS